MENNKMLAIFNETANTYYLNNTEKSYEELDANGYLSYEKNSWSDGLIGNEWEDEAECKICAEEAATQAIEKENK